MVMFFACNPSGSDRTKSDVFAGGDAASVNIEAFEVIYSLNLPTEIATLFEETGTGFNPDLLLPLEKIPIYEEAGHVAMLLGALGVDLSYCKLFERLQESAACFAQIEQLADKVGLPAEIFERPSDILEQYLSQPDSLTAMIEQVYRDVHQYFKDNDQESLASLSLLGGWLEAMFIGIRIYQDYEMLEMSDRILQQKYALVSLMGLLGNYQESLVVRQYMHSLNRLKQQFQQVEIKYGEEGFEIRPEERLIQAEVSKIDYDPETLDRICQLVVQIRNEMIP